MPAIEPGLDGLHQRLSIRVSATKASPAVIQRNRSARTRKNCASFFACSLLMGRFPDRISETRPLDPPRCATCSRRCWGEGQSEPEKDRIGAARGTSKSCTDAVRPGFRLGPDVGPSGGVALNRSWKGPRPIRPSPETPDGNRNRDPRKDRYENIPQGKKPLCGNKQGKVECVARANSSSPAWLQQRAGLNVNFANSTGGLQSDRHSLNPIVTLGPRCRLRVGRQFLLERRLKATHAGDRTKS